ncbi:hypothetical protein BLNAU_18428 [Blattamonas nauphoetae]|uniref:Uncharacterized protein n=1 Tax=Blattamonas nauphoetae TaxID=2049346 RepID=A0ABQ9X8V2_9EUKA|nr:hypothetical protein BLNAU_18428 [Blattamonas nauphoetae]
MGHFTDYDTPSLAVLRRLNPTQDRTAISATSMHSVQLPNQTTQPSSPSDALIHMSQMSSPLSMSRCHLGHQQKTVHPLSIQHTTLSLSGDTRSPATEKEDESTKENETTSGRLFVLSSSDITAVTDPLAVQQQRLAPPHLQVIDGSGDEFSGTERKQFVSNHSVKSGKGWEVSEWNRIGASRSQRLTLVDRTDSNDDIIELERSGRERHFQQHSILVNVSVVSTTGQTRTASLQIRTKMTTHELDSPFTPHSHTPSGGSVSPSLSITLNTNTMLLPNTPTPLDCHSTDPDDCSKPIDRDQLDPEVQVSNCSFLASPSDLQDYQRNAIMKRRSVLLSDLCLPLDYNSAHFDNVSGQISHFGRVFFGLDEDSQEFSLINCSLYHTDIGWLENTRLTSTLEQSLIKREKAEEEERLGLDEGKRKHQEVEDKLAEEKVEEERIAERSLKKMRD